MSSRGKIALALGIAIVLGLLSGVYAYDHLTPEYSSYVRGMIVARESGCFSCHSESVGSEMSNPRLSADGDRAQLDRVPSIVDSSKNVGILREWILTGSSRYSETSDRFREGRKSQLLTMRAYQDVLSEEQVDDLITFLMVERGKYVDLEQQDPGRGPYLARKYGCFECHGPLGQGGFSNPGSLKGYVPGFFGRDFDMASAQIANSLSGTASWFTRTQHHSQWARGLSANSLISDRVILIHGSHPRRMIWPLVLYPHTDRAIPRTSTSDMGLSGHRLRFMASAKSSRSSGWSKRST